MPVEVFWAVLMLVIGLGVGFALGSLWYRNMLNSQIASRKAQARLLLEEARSQQKEILLQAKDAALRMRNEAEVEIKEFRHGLQKQEERLQRKEEHLERKLDTLERRERQLNHRERQLEHTQRELDHARHQQQKELERIAGLSQEEAREIILAKVARETRDDAARRIREIEQATRAEAHKISQKIIGMAIQRCAPEYVSELTTSTVTLPNEELKGRIIGREGRNIRAFEQITGVDLIIDDTPEAVTLSCHEPIRREIARIALMKLLKDGRIHPARIEEVVLRTRQEMDQIIREEGERAAYEANVQGLPPDLIRLLGRLKYRSSCGQNVLQHSLECSWLAAHMAAELGANVQVSKTAALLHDIGKAVDHEVQGPHAMIGADIARRLGRSSAIVHAIAAHHGDEEPQSVEAFLVQAADAISGSRPGARRASLDLYIKRLEALETIATSFPGVQRAFAVQAGREVRVLVQPEVIDDLASIHLARTLARKIEHTLHYPGQIKVTVLRETRAVEYAK